MKNNLVIKGDVINLDKVTRIKVIKDLSKPENKTFNLEFYFYNETLCAGPFDEITARVILSKVLDTEPSAVSYIFETTEYVVPITTYTPPLAPEEDEEQELEPALSDGETKGEE